MSAPPAPPPKLDSPCALGEMRGALRAAPLPSRSARRVRARVFRAALRHARGASRASRRHPRGAPPLRAGRSGPRGFALRGGHDPAGAAMAWARRQMISPRCHHGARREDARARQHADRGLERGGRPSRPGRRPGAAPTVPDAVRCRRAPPTHDLARTRARDAPRAGGPVSGAKRVWRAARRASPPKAADRDAGPRLGHAAQASAGEEGGVVAPKRARTSAAMGVSGRCRGVRPAASAYGFRGRDRRQPAASRRPRRQRRAASSGPRPAAATSPRMMGMPQLSGRRFAARRSPCRVPAEARAKPEPSRAGNGGGTWRPRLACGAAHHALRRARPPVHRVAARNLVDARMPGAVRAAGAPSDLAPRT